MKTTYVIRPLLPILLAGAAFGVDDLKRMPIGFQMSLGWALPDDRRFEASAVSYYLYVAPAPDVDLGYLREEWSAYGRENGESISVRGHVDAVRARYRMFNDEVQSARLLASAGYARFARDVAVGAFAFDLGAEYVPWKIASAPVAAEVAIQLRYRYCRFAAKSIGDGDVRPVDNAGGLIVGIAGDVRF